MTEATTPERELRFCNGRGQKLVATLSGTVDKTVVVSCHGMLSNRGGDKHRLLARLLYERGLPCVRLDFSGRGDSEGSLFDLSFGHEVEDLQATLAMLAQEGVTQFGLFGSSMGGAVALLTAARDERVHGIATLAAVGHPELTAERNPHETAAWLTRGYIETLEGRIGRGFFDDALRRDVIATTALLQAPVLVLHGEQDEVIPVADAYDIAAAAKNATLEVVPGADHRFSNPVHLRPAMKRVADFLVHALTR